MIEPTLYRLGKPQGTKPGLWAAFTPGSSGLKQTWQLSVTARNRGGAKTLAPLIETGALRSLATVTLKGEAFPLAIDRHEALRGGGLAFGGTRKLGADGGTLEWEMRWTPIAGEEGGFDAEMRLRTTPRRTGALRIELPIPLYRPELWSLPTGGGACAWSAYSGYSVALTAEPDAVLTWAEPGGFALDLPAFSLGGGRLVRFGLRLGAAKTAGDARAALVTQAAARRALPAPTLTPLDPAEAVARLTSPDAYDVQGAERVYLKSPTGREEGMGEEGMGEEGSHYAAFPHEPAQGLKALWDHARLCENEGTPRLVRFGAQGICADFAVMGRGEQPEPNKGAFWDKLTFGVGTDYADGPTHGLLANARLARSLFLLHEATSIPLLRQSALNACQWLLLKQNEGGFYDGSRVHATRGLAGDGRFLPQPCALDGAEAIRAFVLAYRATQTEVWIKASWRIAEFLLSGRLREFDAQSPATVAGVILSLMALDAESANPRLRSALAEWGAWLRVLPLVGVPPAPNSGGVGTGPGTDPVGAGPRARPSSPDPASSPNPTPPELGVGGTLTLPSLNADGLHAGLYDCAQAALSLYALSRDPSYLRYAFHALGLVPAASKAASWRAVSAHQSALLALAGLIPDAKIDFDAPSVTLGWRVFAPDPAAAPFLRVRAAGGDTAWADWLPLVCRGTDQLLLLVLAPPHVEAVSVWKNGKRPLVRDLRTGALDTDTPLMLLGKGGKEKSGKGKSAGDDWARVGLFTVDP